jgi:hypothetical protein
MRKLASLSIAVLASFALAATASATLSATIQGPNTPGTHIYSIVLSTDTSDAIRGIGASINTTGLYTGVWTDGGGVGPFTLNLNGPLLPPVAATTGYAGSWAWSSGATQLGGSFTIGTVQITVGGGDVVMPDFTGVLDGFVTSSFTTVFPNPANVTGITIIPEPTTAALLGLGIVGLVVAGRRNRA